MQCGMTKYRKGPQRTTKEHYTGPQRTGNREKTAGCCVAQKLEFQTTAVSEKLLKISSAALTHPSSLFLLLIYHCAVPALSQQQKTNAATQMLCLLCCFIVSDAYQIII